MVRPVPWRHVASWSCKLCGRCCREYRVVLKPEEWLRLVEAYGPSVAEVGHGKFYLRRRADGSCIFLVRAGGKWLCGLQDMKPKACKLWPFKVLSWPKYGRAAEARITYMGFPLYVYVDPFCPGIRWGEPTPHFVSSVLREAIEIALGVRVEQHHTTSKLPESLRLYLRARRRGP
ncbi:YkgJ family cysteine cluster protein [Candidatus Bathyarchaeota archaeon]|nr:MAG: YkgJ family cysteine cluster protein [Candidatus Bathyarchaeota archaeon]